MGLVYGVKDALWNTLSSKRVTLRPRRAPAKLGPYSDVGLPPVAKHRPGSTHTPKHEVHYVPSRYSHANDVYLELKGCHAAFQGTTKPYLKRCNRILD